MSSNLIWSFAVIIITVGISFFILYVWNNNRKLDARISAGDMELLSSSSYKITEVVRAPAGSRIEKINSQMLPYNAGGYVQQKLPDGRIAMIPVKVVSQPVRSVHSTTHTNQQPPEM
jgi:hypothetical protein